MAVIKVPLLKAGDQIVYLPQHTNGDMNHPDAELGFVVKVKTFGPIQKDALCRYWRYGEPGKLRTVANGEWTNVEDLALFKSVPDSVVEGWFADQDGVEPTSR